MCFEDYHGTIEEKIERIKKRQEGYKGDLEIYQRNVEELQKNIDISTANIADLQAELERVGKRFRAERDGKYWHVDGWGDIIHTTEDFHYADDYRYNTGNYFRTQAEAEAYKQALLTVREHECEIYRQTHIDDEMRRSRVSYHVGADYSFTNNEQAEEFAEALKLILNVKGASESIVTKERFKSVEFEVDNSGN